MRTMVGLLAAALLVGAIGNTRAGESIKLWDGAPPLALANDKPEGELPLEKDQNPDIVRLANVSEPSLTLYPAPADRRNGACVLICPGGGYYILATKHEGTQVAEWLNSIGVTAAVLKYRVPSPKGESPQRRPLLDAQRAMSMLRTHAADWQIDPKRIGVLGFSAGGHLAAWLLCEGDRRGEGYPTIANEPPCRPDFGILIYPAYLAAGDSQRTRPTVHLDAKPGPVFFVHAHDDQLTPENSIEFYLALKRVAVPGELHIFQEGGHGFGMLRNGKPINDWPRLCADWLKATGWLTSSGKR